MSVTGEVALMGDVAVTCVVLPKVGLAGLELVLLPGYNGVEALIAACHLTQNHLSNRLNTSSCVE